MITKKDQVPRANATLEIGHGTEKGLLAGVLGLSVDDRRIKNIFDDEISKNVEYKFEYADNFKRHPNAVDISFIWSVYTFNKRRSFWFFMLLRAAF